MSNDKLIEQGEIASYKSLTVSITLKTIRDQQDLIRRLTAALKLKK